MHRLSDTIVKLGLLKAVPGVGHDAGARLRPLSGFGTNPGALLAKTFIPKGMARGAALVVVLHGCTQNAEGYDRGSGWSQVAEEQGFALLYPEQQRSNNPNLCFNWFEGGDTARGAGEALSIKQMIDGMVADHGIDRKRIFVTGLSAGGAMTSTMLATYPEVFAGGAIIAGLPHGCAMSMPEAFQRMRGAATQDDHSATVLASSDHKGPWPTISIWHGSADRTVDATNAAAIAAQWLPLHGLSGRPSRIEKVDGHPREVWTDAAGRDVIESYSIDGMGHGTPLATAGDDGVGVAGAHMLDVGISSTRHIARFWGLETRPPSVKARPVKLTAEAIPAATNAPWNGPRHASGPGKVIEDALRAAGLMR
jgi:poly(hydroxyalkanoate) depolymerase family esterase